MVQSPSAHSDNDKFTVIDTELERLNGKASLIAFIHLIPLNPSHTPQWPSAASLSSRYSRRRSAGVWAHIQTQSLILDATRKEKMRVRCLESGELCQYELGVQIRRCRPSRRNRGRSALAWASLRPVARCLHSRHCGILDICCSLVVVICL